LLSYFYFFSGISAQDNKTELFTDVETGSKLYYIIKTQEGKVYKARIVTADPENVLLLLAGGKSMTINTNDITEVKKNIHIIATVL